MRMSFGGRASAGLAVASALLAVWSGGASAQNDVQHGIGFTAGCASPTQIGDPYRCAYTVLNVIDEAHDTLTINSLVDTVHAAIGDQTSGNLLNAAQVTITTTPLGTTPSGATCLAASGNGVFPTPYTGVTSCNLPFGSRVNVLSFSHYTVEAADYALPNHELTNASSLTWHDLCDDPAHTDNHNCNPNPPNAGAGSLSAIEQLQSSTATQIHNAAHQVVTAVDVGTPVHDFVSVTGQPGKPVPSGNAKIDWFLNGDCSGTPAASSTVGPLNSSGQFDATGFVFTPTAPGRFAFRGHYLGDATYLGSDGACEPLSVAGDANIQIAPPSASNAVGTNHALTGHVNVNKGSGFENAPSGTTINFSLTNSGGATAAFVGSSSCTTSGGTGSCTVVISSLSSGTTTIKATTDVDVGGVLLHRETNSTDSNSGPASKFWADDTARTEIRDSSNNVVTSVKAGTVVHDMVFVERTANTPSSVPSPVGTVIFHRYATADCSGTPTDQSVVLTVGNPSTAVSDNFAPTGNMSYKADYSGDANYTARTSACEPLAVTPPAAPAIAIVKNPARQTVAKGGTATFRITVTNTGNVPLSDVHVVDPLAPNCNRTKEDIPTLALMAPGATVTYSCKRPTVQADFDNVATAIGTPPSGPNVTATDTVPVKVKPLTPRKQKKKKKPKIVAHKKPRATG
jgi:uncharacterized repeat protein (TIGR01451 family)